MVFVIAAFAIALLATRPFGLPRWVWPVAASLLIVALGYEPAPAAARAILAQWNVLLFIAGLLGISAGAHAAGVFHWITDFILARADGSWRRLFVGLFLTGAVIALLLSNDATAVVLTPIVYRAVTRHGGNPKPFLFACIFVANTASFGLPFSNPANVLILPHARLLPYVWHLAIPQLCAIAAALALLLFFFRREIAGSYGTTECGAPVAAVARALIAMALVVVCYFVALARGWPLGIVASAGAIVVVLAAGKNPVGALRRAGWSVVSLLAGLFVLFDAAARAGFVAWIAAHLTAAMHGSALVATASAAAGAAALSNLFNNLPVAVASSYVAARASAPVAYPLIAGVDLGPNLVTSASLATILWLTILRQYGVRVSFAEYLRLGAAVLPATLLPAILWLSLIR
ncbi:MAG: anion permease [Candidatus Eremiobacteraeota bacterium]|nr:anion permease [Candidatus Eremiobacteraeota bacterium]MBV9264502.1 anion permease [Candidatus Eremiobacteraeota bacterium]